VYAKRFKLLYVILHFQLITNKAEIVMQIKNEIHLDNPKRSLVHIFSSSS